MTQNSSDASMGTVITLQMSDGSDLTVSADTAFQSNLVRQWFADFGETTFKVTHASCTPRMVATLFSRSWSQKEGSDEIVPIVESLDSEISDAETAATMLEACLYLDMDGPIRHLATIPTLLHTLSANGSVDALRSIIEAKADTDSTNAKGETALSVAKTEECRLELLRAKVAKIRSAGYTKTIENWILENIRGLVEISPDPSIDVNARGPDQLSALHIACKHGHLDVVHSLLKTKADVNALVSEDRQESPLYYAAVSGHATIVAALAAAGADLNARTVPDTGATLLHHAASRGKDAVVKALIAARADVNLDATLYTGLWGDLDSDVTPLHLSVSIVRQHLAITEALIAAGCNVHAVQSGCHGNQVAPLHNSGMMDVA
jgi:ankyrin repeat protein